MNGAFGTVTSVQPRSSAAAQNRQYESVNRLAFGNDSALLNPELLKAARHIYRTFYEVHPEVMQRPLGVAIGRANHRGKLVFGDRPVLLPQECFVPFSQIEPGLV